jgi:RNA ligase
MKRYNIDEVNARVESGLLNRCDHAEHPISIYKYSRDCQFERVWDYYTLNLRGTVLDEHGNIVARAFPKFFNIEEVQEIPNPPFEVYEKMDGSLGILFFYGGDWHLATQGSFYSDVAIKGKEILDRNKLYAEKLSEKFTFLFEIIYPQNRIVCDYGPDEKLVMLAAINTQTGRETPYEELKALCDSLGFECVKRYDGIRDLRTIKSLIGHNQEGFVLKFPDGTRIKVKGEEYVRLHKIMTNFSNLDIWDCLRNGTDYRKLMVDIPDEYDEWVRRIEEELVSNYMFIESVIKSEHSLVTKRMTRPRPSEEEYLDRNSKVVKEYNREFYELVKDSPIKHYLFSANNGSDYSQEIWKQIRPEYQKPFWRKENDE